MKKVAFTACDSKNLNYAEKLIKSFRYFHPNTDFVLFTTDKNYKNDTIKIISAPENDPNIWYKQKPYFANKLFELGYDAVLGLDSDQIILGKIDYLFDEDCDLGAVLNFNPLDFKTYGTISVHPIHYATEYLNCGLVLMKNYSLVKYWLELCNGPFFQRLTYKEQDLMNLIAYFSGFNVVCFDNWSPIVNYPPAWHGLLASSETLKAEVRGKEIVIPSDERGYPKQDVLFKVWHPAQGQTSYDKLNYRVKFQEPVIKRINEILGVKDEPQV